MRITLLFVVLVLSVRASAQTNVRIVDRPSSWDAGVLGLSNGDVLLYDRSDSVIVRMAGNGDIVWSRSYGDSIGFADAIEHADGSLDVLCLKKLPTGPSFTRPGFMRIAAGGIPLAPMNVLNERTHDGSSNQLIAGPNDGFYLLTTNMDTYHRTLHHIDSSGAVTWSGDMAGDNDLFNMVMGADGYLYAVVRRSICKFDQAGNRLWERPYFEDSQTHLDFECIIALSDGLAIALRERPGGTTGPAYPVIALIDTSGTITNAIQWNTGTSDASVLSLAVTQQRLVLTALMDYGSFVSAAFICGTDLSSPSATEINVGGATRIVHVAPLPSGGVVMAGENGSGTERFQIATDQTLDFSNCFQEYPATTSGLVIEPLVPGVGVFVTYTSDWYTFATGGADWPTTSVTYCISTSTNDRTEEGAMEVLPGDRSGTFVITLPTSGYARLSVIDPMGRVVWQGSMVGARKEVDLSQLATGQYVVRVDETRGHSTARRVMIAL